MAIFEVFLALKSPKPENVKLFVTLHCHPLLDAHPRLRLEEPQPEPLL